ncbi:aldehyde dehydrogenase family protein [Thermoflexus sp.]|uniref:aldehyde dehydrogenase family protein n=1 Tax=Thermoflexus sp. TaxID=1969742 RepID=UPI0035E45861
MAVRERVRFGEAKQFIGGQWTDGGTPIPVRDKYTGEVIGTVPEARREDVEAAVAAAQEGAKAMASLPAWRRAEILRGAAERIRAQKEEFARLIAAEAGKALKWARAEVERAIWTFTIAAEEARRIEGEVIPLDAVPAGEGYFGFYVRRPVGVVAAITPFNFPLNLVAHKVAPALAAGNAVVLKPASATPLTAVRLAQVLEAAGIPAGGFNLIFGPGGTVGEWLAGHPGVGKVSFTGSRAVGDRLTRVVGIKKLTLELGNTTPVIVAEDVKDLDWVARRLAVGAFYNSGQVCISVQRIYGVRRIFEPLVETFSRAASEMVVGDPLDERVDVGPLIDEREAMRVEGWIQEALHGGAEAVAGARREGPIVWPTVLIRVRPEMRVVREEVFGPVASMLDAEDFEEALAAANATEYGLQVAVFTRDINRVLRAIQGLDFGGIIINDTPSYRADHMPYGGVKGSGLGREGVRYAIEEMTNIHMVVIRPAP